MKKILLSALLASSTLVMLADSAFAKDCPPLNEPEITAIDSKRISLRTDPNKKEQDTSKTEGTKAFVNDGDKLLILSDQKPEFNSEEETCYYAVELGQDNKSNKKKEVLSYKPYWISEKGIKDYPKLASNPQEVLEQTAQSSTPSDVDEKDDSSGFSLPPWLPLTLISVLNILTLGLLIYLLDKQEKNSKSIKSNLDTKITNSFQAQNLKLGGELQNLQSHIGRNKEHIKQLEGLLKTQNEHLRSLVDSIKSGSLSLSKSEPLNQQIDRAESTVFGAMYSPQSESYQPGFVPVDDQGDIQETQQNSGHDSFYSDVISQFNAGSDPWFSSQIENRVFGKVQITKNSVLGQMDMGGKITQLELNEQGTLLIYQAENRFWIIPDPTQAKWKRAITDSLFNGSSGQILVQPAEVESLGNGLWQLFQKGEFR